MPELSVRTVGTLSKPGVYNDGDGLHLRLSRKGVGSWFLRTAVHGKKTDIGLGSLRSVTLAEARREAVKRRAVARKGGDPLAQRSLTPTFREAAQLVLSQQVEPTAKNAKHRTQWITTLETYAYPVIGDRPVDAMGRPEILRILQPIWLSKPETARRVRQRLRTVFAWAITAGHREAANPVTDIALGLPPQKVGREHHAALPWEELPAFMAELDGVDTISAQALRFAILTCARLGEVRGARWSEIDADAHHWIVPAERMKAGVEHRVPLGDEARAILEQVRGLHPDLIFPGLKNGMPVSDTSLRALLRRMKRTGITVHGFRSTFRDWVSDATDFSGELAEHCLAHRVGSAVERAYARSDRLGKRRTLLEAWEAHCRSDRKNGVPEARVAEVGAFV